MSIATDLIYFLLAACALTEAGETIHVVSVRLANQVLQGVQISTVKYI